MAESVPTMDNSEEEFYDVPDSFLELHRGEGEKTPPASQTDYAPSPGQVAALNAESKASQSVTEPNPPVQFAVYQVSSESLSLRWDTPAGEVESYIVTCCHEGDVVQESTDTNTLTLSHLKPGVCYSLLVSTQLRNGRISKPAATSAKTKTHLESLLEDLGLEDRLKEKLSLSTILQIDKKTITDEPPKCNADLPWYFLKKLMMVNVTARNVKLNSTNSCDRLNPLDIITALFLCSDGFVRQELSLKMSMCQFSVPLLLPNCDTKQCTLMLWAMRDIVKKYRPQSLTESKGFIEERIVLSELPMISFVRLGECSLSKSEILNKLLSNDTFVHHDMECGDSPRRISNGLVEISWYLPCGNKNMDVFSEPVAVANLRGDIASFQTQFSFLCQTSAAVFVFFDTLDSECELLTNQQHKTQIFLVGNHQSNRFSMDALQNVAAELGLTNNNILLKTKQMNDADFVKTLGETVSNVVENSKMKMRIEQMADIAHKLGILVDEESSECQTAKKNADAITTEIQDILQYKEAELPLQGQIWKELTRLEKEEFRLRNVGSKNIEDYKSDLLLEKTQLRKEQNSHDISNAMTCFINAISSPEIERCYFLKWMRMNLDNVSREKLSDLRERYKEKCKNPENKEEIKDIDRQLSNSSLGIEHFFREMGQIYEASLSLPETEPSREQLQHLPKLCAQLLLDGLPLELVDGEASNIPLRWISDVLSQLNDLMSPLNKILVVTVLGVQSTGKSTLLNTMFGVQFAVSSGRCTRGAFMLLIRINEDIKKELNCDFMMIIDTEGLKSPELAQLDNSHEHDNELATLVVGLSDVTIINIAMENSTEMKDILQIVVHAFLRMKEVGKKPKCQFVHQNVSDVSAHEKNLRDRKLLMQQLNEMTQAAAKMEKKEENKNFSDVMEYSPDTGNCYIPGLWNGSPPMAPVNAGYSEAVYELKKNIIHVLGSCESSANDILEFTEWMKSLWNAVKHENFIFSFRNSLVADAYMKLCTEFNKWEWEFRQLMYTWVTDAETRIRNFGTVAGKSEISDMSECVKQLKSEASTILSEWETKLLENLAQGHVYLVEEYKEGFANGAKSLRRQMQSSVFNQLTAAADIRNGMTELEKIKENHTKELEGRVRALIEECQKKNIQMTEKELDEEFDKMWTETQKELSFEEMKFDDIYNSCQKKAEEFTRCCLKPAVEDFVYRSLGPDIIGEMLTNEQFSTRMSFQYSVLLDLLRKDDFENYRSYICSYEEYVKNWILDKIVKRFSEASTIFEFEDRHVQSSIRIINAAVNKAKTEKSANLESFVKNVCQELGDKLVISQDALGAFMILNNADQEQFAHWLTECVKDMAQVLQEEFNETDILMKLIQLNVHPQKELFTKLIGCGKQCPFCSAPCEAGGQEHSEHFASLHRSIALGQYRCSLSQILSTDICSSLVITPNSTFRCGATNWERHHHKDYKAIFPDWKISPDGSLEASDYWKYVLAKFNNKFAKAFKAEPADIPVTWNMITPQQAEESLKESFNIK
ncbi:up-regulator of cell proliferation-like [Pseudoliparis swirei]|uniref:up-regulator of cell proliferation-like n=1 Tax=Pseudoliparis swirei TaxID=2059687 RepID=UPI0024BE891C|nr:up-regulator of cell proliferation-like [Pseudoliparis swirei]